MLSGEMPAAAAASAAGAHDITTWSQPRRARAGVGRSYQRTTIFPEFSVFENCRLCAQAAHPKPLAFWESAAHCKASGDIASAALRAAGLSHMAERQAGSLSHGGKRQLEIAMCLATQPRVLLLDEPLAGMGAEETDRMLQVLGPEARPRHPAGRTRHGRGVPHRRPHHRDGQRRGHRQRRRPTPSAATATCRWPTWVAMCRMTPVTVLLQADGLQHLLRRQPHPARRDAAAEGQALGLLGRNGMGKTTLIRTMMGYVRAAPGPGARAGDRRQRPHARAHGAAGHRLRARRARHLPQPERCARTC
jgi:ABC-type branched-subunit amino acid transport system ATPase component